MNKKKERHKKNKISKTPKGTLKLKARILTSLIDKSKGLVGLKTFLPIYFETRFGIHTLGMSKPIDVFILNDKDEVVKIKRNIKPGSIFFWNPKYSRVLETPKYFLKANLKDKINIIEN